MCVNMRACVVGMPVKDTIKIADTDGFIKGDAKAQSRMADSDTTGIFYVIDLLCI